MFVAEEFIIFGSEHLITIFLILGISIILPLSMRVLEIQNNIFIGKLMGFIMILNEVIKPFYYPALYPEKFNFLNCLPLHVCNLSSLFIAGFLITNLRFFYNMSFFWGISGVLMALTQPDYPFDFPDLHFILFNISHGLLLFAICFSSITLNNRPNLKSFLDTIIYSIPIALFVLASNLIINFYTKETTANYWYMMEFPLGENLTQYMPDPPLHMFFFMPIALALFTITYLPFYLRDKFFSH